MTGAARAAALAALVFAAACDELGNPDLSARHTRPTTWARGPVRLETRTMSVPPSREGELLRAIAPATLHHADFFAPKGGVVTLVIVTPTFGAAPRLRVVALVTEFRLRDGTTVLREWAAPAHAPAYYGGFGLPSTPVDATTALRH